MSALLNGNVTSGTDAAALTIDTASVGVNEVRLIVYNNGSVTAYLGGAGVTASNGFPLVAAGAYEWPVRVGSGVVHHVTASGSTDLRWLAVT